MSKRAYDTSHWGNRRDRNPVDMTETEIIAELTEIRDRRAIARDRRAPGSAPSSKKDPQEVSGDLWDAIFDDEEDLK